MLWFCQYMFLSQCENERTHWTLFPRSMADTGMNYPNAFCFLPPPSNFPSRKGLLSNCREAVSRETPALISCKVCLYYTGAIWGHTIFMSGPLVSELGEYIKTQKFWLNVGQLCSTLNYLSFGLPRFSLQNSQPKSPISDY